MSPADAAALLTAGASFVGSVGAVLVGYTRAKRRERERELRLAELARSIEADRAGLQRRVNELEAELAVFRRAAEDSGLWRILGPSRRN